MSLRNKDFKMKPETKADARWKFWRDEGFYLNRHKKGDGFGKKIKKAMNRIKRRLWKKRIKNYEDDYCWR